MWLARNALLREFAPSSLQDIYEFNTLVKCVEKDLGKLVFCPGVDASAHVHMCFLLGVHLIMLHGRAFEETFMFFWLLHDLINRSCEEKGVHS